MIIVQITTDTRMISQYSDGVYFSGLFDSWLYFSSEGKQMGIDFNEGVKCSKIGDGIYMLAAFKF